MPDPRAKQSWNIAITGTTTALIVLAALGTLLIRIPIPASTGYFNVGDVFVVLAGLWLGPLAGLLVGMIGPTIADTIGYPQFIFATAVTKGFEGLLVGLIGRGGGSALGRRVIAAAVGAITITIGYFVFEAYLYPWLGHMVPFFNVTTFEAALIEAPLNLIQGVIGGAVGFGLWKAVSGFNPMRHSDTSESPPNLT
jgi:uncharacterized membrane protein